MDKIKNTDSQSCNNQVVIVGGGAAGMFCAITAASRGFSVTVLEQMPKIANKIKISGGGRCNFTNIGASAENYLSDNPHFCKSALSRYSPYDFIKMLENNGLSYNEKQLGQLFCDQKSEAIINMLKTQADQLGVNILCGQKVTQIEGENYHYHITAESKAKWFSNHVVLATGGPSFPKLGGSDFVLRVAKRYGLKNKPFVPALVPLTLAEDVLQKTRTIAGVSSYAKVGCGNQFFMDDLLFTHKGLSGPVILQISSYWQKGDAITIDFLPNTNIKIWLNQLKKHQSNKQINTILSTKLPSRLVGLFFDEKLLTKKVQEVSDQEVAYITKLLSNWVTVPTGTEGMKKAEVCTGGVCTNEISSKTLESKNNLGLYFIGEAVDVTGWLGGYNFQWAWASAWACANELKI